MNAKISCILAIILLSTMVYAEDAPLVSANVINSTTTTVTIEATSDQIVDFDTFYGTSPDNLNSDVLALDTTNTQTTLANLQSATFYYYYVKACNANDVCSQTDIATFTTAPPIIAFDLSNITNESVMLNASADLLVDFNIFYGIGNTDISVLAGFDTPTTSFTLAGLQPNTTYNITIQGCSAGNVCAFAESRSFTTLANVVLIENSTNVSDNYAETNTTGNTTNITNTTNTTETNTTENSTETNITSEMSSGPSILSATSGGSSGGSGRRHAFVPSPDVASAPTSTPETPTEPTVPSEPTPVPTTEPVPTTTPPDVPITGAVTGNPETTNWVWPAVIVILIAIGFAIYAWRKRQISAEKI